MNDSYRNNEVEYCSMVIYCFKTKHKFKKNSSFSQGRGRVRGGGGGWAVAEGVQSQDTTPDRPCIIIIYLEYT